MKFCYQKIPVYYSIVLTLEFSRWSTFSAYQNVVSAGLWFGPISLIKNLIHQTVLPKMIYLSSRSNRMKTELLFKWVTPRCIFTMHIGSQPILSITFVSFIVGNELHYTFHRLRKMNNNELLLNDKITYIHTTIVFIRLHIY